jgi:RNA polymerase sigma factor (TIGR02999 family)
MDGADLTETTLLLRQWASGDSAALERLTPRVYSELHRIAGRLMAGEYGGRTLAATGLVHEAYLRLVDTSQVSFIDRAHFLGVAAKMMRRILLDQARRRHAAKRGGGVARVDWDAVAEVAVGKDRDESLLLLDEALHELATVDPRRAQVVEMRYFGGLSVEETAAALKVSGDTVIRDWRLARAWLASRIDPRRGDTP